MKRSHITAAGLLALAFVVGDGVTWTSANAASGDGVTWTQVRVAEESKVTDLKIKEWGWNAPGPDTTSNRNDEFVRVQNTAPEGSGPLKVEGWVIHDTYQNAAGDWGNRFTFKGSSLPAGSPFKAADGSFQIPAGYSVVVYNGSGVDSQPTNNVAAVYRNFKHHWNNGSETLYVRESASATGYVAAIVKTSYRMRIYQ